MKHTFQNKISLDGKWRLFFEENCNLKGAEIGSVSSLLNSGFKNIEAIVPGNYELDLMEKGIIEDVFFGLNPLDSWKRENLHFWYATEFDFNDEGEYSLCFEGIDTFADIYLNGSLIGKTENMFIPYSFDVNLNKGKNELVVHIKPTFLYSRENPIDAGSIIHQFYNAESLNIRKAAHMFGWDIMPRILSAGIWKSVALVKKKNECIKEAYLRTVNIIDDKAYLRFYYNTEIKGDFAREYSLKIEGNCGDSSFEKIFKLYNSSGTVNSIEIEEPKLWWTKDFGEQNLYDVRVTLYHFDDQIDECEFRLGVRKFELERSSVAGENGKFGFKINGQPLFVRGTNWVPLDAFHSRDKERLPKALELLYESNCNMVRMWGGNVYESQEFYDFCDEKGIAVWQDFGMGCAAYPQNEKLFDLLKEEIEIIVKSLRQHTCIALWAGDNECDEATVFWTKGSVDPNRNLITRKLIPEILNRHDPERIFLPSSPYIDEFAFTSGEAENTPEKHLWGPRDYFKGEYYATSSASFASETGYHGCPAPSSIEKFISKDKLWPWQDNDEWLVHATAMELDGSDPYAYRIELMANQIKVLFGVEPETLEEFAKMSQASQAEADKYFIERFRSAKWKRTGIIWWNLLDGWPQFSDAVVDYYYNKKLAFNIIKNCQEPISLMFREPEGNKITLVGANDTLKDTEISYEVVDYTVSKIVKSGKFTLKANGINELCALKIKPEESHYYLIKWQIDGKEFKNYYVCAPIPYKFEDYYEFMKNNGFWEADGI